MANPFRPRRVIAAVTWCLAVGLCRLGQPRACTTGCVVGRGSADGRPISWKNRDEEGAGNHALWYVSGRGPYGYLAMGWGGDLKMGVNAAGLSLQNSLLDDLGSRGFRYANNTAFKEWVLSRCGSIADVRRAIVEDTGGAADHWPAPSICAMLSDAHGAACCWELAGSAYYEYDPASPARLGQVPQQFVCRTNTSHRRRDQADDRKCRCGRYQTAFDLLRAGAQNGGITIAGLIGISRHGEPGAGDTISNETTLAAMIVHGVNDGEDPRIVTAWVACGRPDYTCYVPVWVAQQGDLSPRVTSTKSDAGLAGRSEALYDRCRGPRSDDRVNGLLAPAEANILDAVAAARERWLRTGFRLEEARSIHFEAAENAWCTLQAMSRGPRNRLNEPPRLGPIQVETKGMTVDLGGAATDADGRIAGVDWDFGDGGQGATASCTHTYQAPGTYLVRCRAVDDSGARNSRWTYVTVR